MVAGTVCAIMINSVSLMLMSYASNSVILMLIILRKQGTTREREREREKGRKGGRREKLSKIFSASYVMGYGSISKCQG